MHSLTSDTPVFLEWRDHRGRHAVICKFFYARIAMRSLSAVVIACYEVEPDLLPEAEACLKFGGQSDVRS